MKKSAKAKPAVKAQAIVTWHADGSVTLSSHMMANLIDNLREWETVAGWTRRDDCKNWKRSPIARENRRESIVYGNCLSTIRATFGNREIAKRMSK